MEWIKCSERLPPHGIYPVKIEGYINYCSFSFGHWYWMQAINAENMMLLRKYPLVGMEMRVDEWLDLLGNL